MVFYLFSYVLSILPHILFVSFGAVYTNLNYDSVLSCVFEDQHDSRGEVETFEYVVDFSSKACHLQLG